MWMLVALLLFSALCQAQFVEEYQAQSNEEYIHLAKCTINCAQTTLQETSFWLNLITQVTRWDYKEIILTELQGTDIRTLFTEDEVAEGDFNDDSCKEVLFTAFLDSEDLEEEELGNMSCDELLHWIFENTDFEGNLLLLINLPNLRELVIIVLEGMAEQGELEQEIVDMFEELNFEKLMLEFFELLAELRDIDPRFVVELLRMDWREELSNMVKNTSINKKLLEFVKCISIDADTGIISIKQEPNCPVNKYKLSERLFPALYDMTCDLYGAWETCASECPELDSNRRVHDILPYVEGFHFVCNSLGKDFLSYFPCFDRCDKQCTAPLTYLSTMNIPRKFDTQTGGLTFAYQAALKRLCSAYSCLLQCQTSHALKNCPGEKGQIAATILETIAEKTLGGLLKLFKTHYPNVVFAKECEKFAEQSDPVITMNKIIM